MDYLRKCYVTRVRPFAGSGRTAVVRWYWAPEGAPVLRGPIWRSSFWYAQDLDGQYPAPPPIGEERSVPFRWSPGRAGQDLAIAKCTVGDPAWFNSGIPPAALVPNPPPTPACCRITPALARGGLWLGGLGRLREAILGGLRLGGRAVRPAVPVHFGGLRLGGVAGLPRAAGGLRLGGVAAPAPPPLVFGGWLIGGEALLELLAVEGGLRLGGVQETEPAPVGVGGFRIGGEAQEPMALLYCSLRAAAPAAVPNNALTVLDWDTVEEDPSGMFSLGSPSRITVPVGGVYLVQHQLNYGGSALNFGVEGNLRVNGSGYQGLYAGGTGGVGASFHGGAALLELLAGDYLQVDAYQFSGGPVTPTSSGYLQASFRVAALAPDPPTGRLLGVQRFTAPGAYTYTPTLGTQSVIIELQGGGGGGGGAPSAGSGNRAMGGGGGGGSWLRKLLTANFSGATGSVGAGGTAGANTGGSGGTGGSTTFITSGGGPVTYTATGGAGGGGGFAVAPPAQVIGGSGSAVSGGDDNVTGAPGGPGTGETNFNYGTSGFGGSSRYSGGAIGVATNATNASVVGNTADGFGGGGSGAMVHGTGTAKTGGAGSGGCVVIWEYS